MLTFGQSSLNEVMQVSAQTIADKRAVQEELVANSGAQWQLFYEWEGKRGGEHGDCTVAAGDQLHSWLPWASAQQDWGPGRSAGPANPTLHIPLLDGSTREVTVQGLRRFPFQADAALLDA